MDIKFSNLAIQNVASDALVVGVAYQQTGQKSPALSKAARVVDDALDGLLQELYASGEFKGEVGELTTVHTMGKLTTRRVVLVGLGKQEKLQPLAIQRACGAAARHLQQTGAHTIALACLLEDAPLDVEAQAQAAHAERMIALGELAGGIAHDFNNLLQAIAGSAGLIERRREDPEEVRRRARLLLAAVERGGSISRRLLAFARRDILVNEPVDPEGVLKELCDLLGHTLGSGIAIRMEAEPGLPALLADIIRHGLGSRVGGVTVAELAGPQNAAVRLREIDPDIVIVGPADQRMDASLIRTILPHVQVLTVSADLSLLVDLDTGEHGAFTPDALAERLRR